MNVALSGSRCAARSYSRAKRSVRLRALLALLLAGMLPVRMAAAQQAPPSAGAGSSATLPSAGEELERPLGAGESHAYAAALDAGQFLRLRVLQRGIDVIVTLSRPDGSEWLRMDALKSTQSPEFLLALVETSGTHTLRVFPAEKNPTAGRYLLRIEELRESEEPDAIRMEAQRLFIEAEKLRMEATAASLRAAIGKYESALPQWRQTAERRGEVETLNKIGLVYSQLGEPRKALGYFEKCLPIRRELGDKRGEGIAFNNIAEAYKTLGEMQLALDAFARVRPLVTEIGDRRGQAVLLSNIGVTYGLLGQNRNALQSFQESLPIAREIGDKRVEILALHNLGASYMTLKDFERAQESFHSALTLERQIGDLRQEASTLQVMSRTLHELGRDGEALEALARSLTLARETGNRQGEAAALTLIGTIQRDRGERGQASSSFQRALEVSRAIGEKRLESRALVGLAKVERDRGELAAARSHVEEALAILETMRAKIAAPGLRTSYFASVREPYELDVDLLMSMHRENPSARFDLAALESSERARARGLVEILNEAHVDFRRDLDPALRDREAALQRRINARAESQMRLLSGNHTTQQAAAAAGEIESLLAEYQQLQSEIRRRSPSLASLGQPPALTAEEMREEILDGGTVVLEYGFGEKGAYLWVVTPEAVESHDLGSRADVEKAARIFYERLAEAGEKSLVANRRKSRARIAREEAARDAAAASLSKLLLAPAAGKLAGRRIVIAAEGALQYVPFAALADPCPEHSTDPLIVGHEIAFLPSVTALAAIRRDLAGRERAAKAVAVIADPVFDREDPRLPARYRSTRKTPVRLNAELESAARSVGLIGPGGTIPRLPFTRREAETILSSVEPDQALRALDFAANRATATGPELGTYRIVHFATHGFVNADQPELSGLVLSLVDEKGASRDGFLRLHEIYNLDLAADLVVLSACQTALGGEIRGEGLVGLTRGFMHAGSPRVVASLWRVDDAATAELMRRFYGAMLGEKSLSPAAALRAAQVGMRETGRWRDPFAWAGFVLQGEWR